MTDRLVEEDEIQFVLIVDENREVLGSVNRTFSCASKESKNSGHDAQEACKLLMMYLCGAVFSASTSTKFLPA